MAESENTAIATYIFIDLGAPGLLKDEPNPIISLSLLAVRSEDLRDIKDNEKQDLITSPKVLREVYRHRIDEEFDAEQEIEEFIKSLPKPVCLIAYSAFNYDFPLLKSMLNHLEASFLNDITCADSMAAFYDILMPGGEKTSRAERLEGSFPWPSWFFDKPSFGLAGVYHRELESTEFYKSRGQAGLDNLSTVDGRNRAAVRLAVKLSDDFPIWLEKNCYRFSEVPLKPKNIAE